MSVIVATKNQGQGQFLHVSGKRICAFKFTRRRDNFGIHELVFPTFDAFNKVSEELLTTKGNPPMVVQVVPEGVETDAKLAAELEAAKASIAEKDTLIEQLRQQLANPPMQPAAGLTDTQKDMLAERDEILAVLAPLAVEDETPLSCLVRLLKVDAVETESGTVRGTTVLDLPYEDLLRHAKEQLGLTFEKKPAKPVLVAAVKEKLGGQQ